MKAFFIVLFIFSLGQLATNSGTYRDGGCLSRYKGGFCSKPNNLSIQSLGYLFTFDGIKGDMQKSSSGTVYPDASGDSITARFYDLGGESRISSYNGNSQNLSDQPITDLQTTVYTSNLPAGAYSLKYGNGKTLEVGRLIKE